jgi:multisubunit Na+/H+ antiporter MnhB subunit
MSFALIGLIGVWLFYFSLIFFPLRSAYDRRLGPPPPEREGERLEAWARRRTHLRRWFIAAGIGLAVLPLAVIVAVALIRG